MNQHEPNPADGFHPTPFTDSLLNQGNRKFASLVRDDELECIRRGIRPVDLRAIPPEDWKNVIYHDLILPPAVAAYLDDRDTPLVGEEADLVADQVAAFHGLKEPWYVEVSSAREASGRAWNFLPEAAEFLTGFRLMHE